MNTKRIAVWAALAASLIPASANASVLNVLGRNPERGSTLTMKYDGVDVTGFAGAERVSVDGSSVTVDMFCLDITTRAVLNSPYNAIVLQPASMIYGERAVWMFTAFNSSAQDVVTGAALQLALWDVIHDGGDGFDAGHFQTTASIPSTMIAQAQVYVAASRNFTPVGGAAIYESVLGRKDRQLMIGEVPEPGTVALLGSGLVLVGLVRRKRK